MHGGVPLATVILAGHLLPWLFLPAAIPGFDALAGLLALGGLAVYDHLWISAPQRLPLA